MRARVVVIGTLIRMLAGCASPPPASVPAATRDGTPAIAPVASAPLDAAPAPTSVTVAPDPRIGDREASQILAGGHVPDTCVRRADAIECMLARAYAADRDAAAAAVGLYRDTGDVAGPGEPEDMDGGYRGIIHLVPALPTGRDRRHLTWVAAAMRDYDAFFTKLGGSGASAPRYRWRDLAIRFVRSVHKRTPSAFALPWTVSYNLDGSLLTSQDAVRETLFHEIFHMNDGDHGDWSGTALRADYDAIVATCGTTRASSSCLARYAPSDTKVRGGTYYAFQQDNGDPVHEYAAELALRYYREEREMMARGRLSRTPFKCGAPENSRSWRALVDEFFAGRDLIPACR